MVLSGKFVPNCYPAISRASRFLLLEDCSINLCLPVLVVDYSGRFSPFS